MTDEKQENMGRPVDNLDDVLQSMRTTAVERGGGDGFFRDGPVSQEVQKYIDTVIGKFRKHIDPATALHYKFGPTDGRGSAVLSYQTIAKVGKLENTEIYRDVANALLKAGSGRQCGDVQRADILTANYRYDNNVGLYLRYVEQTSICTAARDTYFDLGAFENPPNLKEIAENGSPNMIKVKGDGLILYQDGSRNSRLKLDEVITKVYHVGLMARAMGIIKWVWDREI